MPLLVMHSAQRCHLCRCRIRGVQVGQFRINKRTLKATDRGVLVATDRECVECGTPTLPVDRWRLDEKSQALVDTHRASKGWS